MGNIKSEILNRIFKKGLKAVDLDEVDWLFKNTRGKLYRHEWNPDRLAREGFSTKRMGESAKEALDSGGQGYNRQEAEVFDEARGLYYYPYKKRPESIYWEGRKRGGPESINVVGIPRPNAEIVDYGELLPNEYMRFPKKGSKVITTAKDIPPTADFVHDTENGPWGSEVIQRKPGNVLAKITTSKGDIYKILGAMGLALGATMKPDEAEAFPIGKSLGKFATFAEAMVKQPRISKEMTKIGQVQPAKSSANDLLKGMDFQGSKISGVYQGGGKKRYIHLEDGRVFPTDQKSIHSLSAEYGTQKQLNKFETKPLGSMQSPEEDTQWGMILKSLQYNEARGVPPRHSFGQGTKEFKKYIIQNHMNDVKSMTADELADQVFVQSLSSKKYFMWPRKYAEPAEAARLVKILDWSPYKE